MAEHDTSALETQIPIATVAEVTHHFGRSIALSNVTFALDGQGITGLVGPNGAGKTTLLRALAGLVNPSQGSISAAGSVHYSTTPGWAWADQSVRSLTKHMVWRYPGFDAALAQDYIRRFGVKPHRRRGLSRGQTSALHVSLALATRADITLLDEPHAGMDSRSRGVLASILAEEFCAQPRQILIATHFVDEIAPMLERVLVLTSGSLIADSTPEDLARRYRLVEGVTYGLGLLPTAAVVDAQTLGHRVRAIVDTHRLDGMSLSTSDLAVSQCGLQRICEAIASQSINSPATTLDQKCP